MSSKDISGPLYIGFDLSTQQLKALVIDSSLKVHHTAKVDFDSDLSRYGIHKGVLSNTEENEVFAPVCMWLEALDLVLSRLRQQGTPFEKVRGVSGSGQQHGSVFWSEHANGLLETLGEAESLVGWLKSEGEVKAFSSAWSPNWQDASTQAECDAFDEVLGSEETLAAVTGSKAHHRFTGPQIMRLRKKHPEVYKATARISLVSSFLASVLIGKFAPIDISDVCGMDLWNVKKGAFDKALLELAAGKGQAEDLRQKLGEVYEDGGKDLGQISDYFIKKYGFTKACTVSCFTGDNPATILALPLRPLDAIVSLGTSTTFLMATPKYVTDPSYHFFNSPTTAGIYMFMLCYKNGGLAREQIRDGMSTTNKAADSWTEFNKAVLDTPPLCQKSNGEPAKLGLYFPRPEIVPNVRAGTWRYEVKDGQLNERKVDEAVYEDARTIVESQMLSMRLRSRKVVVDDATKDYDSKPPQPRRIYCVGGGSVNEAIIRVIGEVLGGTEGVWRLDVSDACALGGAYKAVWACERKEGETFEDLIGDRWRESEAVEKVGNGYDEKVWNKYEKILPMFEEMEERIKAGEKK